MMNRRTFLKGIAGGGVVAGGAADAAAVSNESTARAGQEATGTVGESTATGAGATSGSGTASGTGASGSGGATTHTVEMWTKNGSYYFDPIGLYVSPGDTVKWVIGGGDHSATAYAERIPKGASAFDSGVLKESGASFTHTFETAGTYDYFCTPHKTLGMVGRVVCGEPGGPAEEGAIPNAPGDGLMPSSKDIVKAGSLSYPYVPNGSSSGSLPWQFWAAAGGLGTAAVAMASKYDRASGRYGDENLPESR